MPTRFKAWTTVALKAHYHEIEWLVGHFPTSAKELEAFLDDFFRVTQEPSHSVDYFYSLGRVGEAERLTVWNDQGVGVILDLVPIPDANVFGVPRTGLRKFVHTADRRE
jgi:hypothetical protein